MPQKVDREKLPVVSLRNWRNLVNINTVRFSATSWLAGLGTDVLPLRWWSVAMHINTALQPSGISSIDTQQI
jgi:hypothetical protein